MSRWRYAVLATAVSILLPSVGIGLTFLAAVTWQAEERAAPYFGYDAASRAAWVVDRRGRSLGVLDIGAHLGRSTPGGWERHLAVMPARPPSVWLEVLTAIEDRNSGRWWHLYGIDLLAFAAALRSYLLEGRVRGGSTLVMQLVRSMRHLRPGVESGGMFGALRRKWTEVLDGAAIWSVTGGLESITLQRLLASHLPLVIGLRGSPIGGSLYGVEIAGRVLFGKAAAELSMAEQAILAAAVRRPVVLARPEDPKGRALRDGRWAYLRQRAAFGLRRAFGDRPEVRAALRELANMPPPEPDRDRLRAFAGDGAWSFAQEVNPRHRAVRLLGAGAGSVLAEVEERLGRAALDRLVSIELAFDVDLQARLRERVEAGVSRAFAAVGAEPRGARYLLLVTDGGGRVLALVTNDSNPTALGLVRGETGRYAPWQVHLASLAKIAGALALAGRDRPGSLYCDRRIDNPPLRDPDGSRGHADCRDGRAWLTAREVFARSWSLALLWRLAGLERKEVRAALAAARMVPVEGTGPEAAASYGLATARPVDLIALLNAIGAGIEGEPAAAPPARLALAASLATPQGDVADTVLEAGAPLALDTYFARPGARRFLASVLHAPLERRGTAAALGRHPLAAPPAIAKTGTDVSGERLLAKWLIGRFGRGSRAVAVVFVLFAADPGAPLPRRLRSAHLAKILGEVLDFTTKRQRTVQAEAS